jgi:hypothetical protein
MICCGTLTSVTTRTEKISKSSSLAWPLQNEGVIEVGKGPASPLVELSFASDGIALLISTELHEPNCGAIISSIFHVAQCNPVAILERVPITRNYALSRGT